MSPSAHLHYCGGDDGTVSVASKADSNDFADRRHGSPENIPAKTNVNLDSIVESLGRALAQC